MSGVIIDTDPGIDDAIAIIYGVQKQLRLKGITTVYGNADIDSVTQNALEIIRLTCSEVKVFKGEDKPLKYYASRARSHGAFGLGGYEFERADCAKQPSASTFLATALSEEKSIILCLGPVTNIARLLQERPDLKNQICEIVIMAGAINAPGNISKYAEFNAYNDPHALSYLLEAGVSVTLLPVNICRQVVVPLAFFLNLNSKYRDYLVKMVEPYIHYYKNDPEYGGYRGAVLYDLLAVMLVSKPYFFDSEICKISVVLEGAKRGQTRRIQGEPTCRLITHVNTSKVLKEYKKVMENE